MIDEKIIVSGREVIGQYLKGVRKEKGISIYRIEKETGVQRQVLNSIEDGSKAYTIDSFLKYTTAIGVYLFFGDKEGKKDEPLDADHMLNELDINNPFK